ncbi:hypothetical protein ACRAR1_16905 [Streptomyces sanyensis]|uniref:hypothetical protein n=1 Tax=Streptomyces sanyensis TaxID=568869 RepID=UPI003D7761C3
MAHGETGQPVGSPVDGQAKEDARRRPAGEGVTGRNDGTWADAACPGRRLTAAEVAVARAGDVFGEESEPPEARACCLRPRSTWATPTG